MTFLQKLSEVLELEDELSWDYALSPDEWDSLAIISTIALIDKEYGIVISGSKLEGIQSMRDLQKILSDEGIEQK